MRPLFAILLSTAIVGVVGAYSGFLNDWRAEQNDLSGERQPLLVCSTTQVADFARQIVGDRWIVKSVLAAGQDPHLYEIKTGDAELVAQADLCAENGWHLEGKDWMRRLATTAGKTLVTCVTNLEPLELDEDGEKVNDPHAWFTPHNASVFVKNILAGVCERDPAHKAEYEARAALYLEELENLDRWIKKQCDQIPQEKRILVTSHDAFNYFCRGYGFKSAAPAGWSTGDEVGGGVTNERRRIVVDSIKEFGVKAIFVETSVNPKMIRVIASEAGVNVGRPLYSDSMGEAGTGGETYIGMMRENVLNIVEALK